jgi:hypothetical protein
VGFDNGVDNAGTTATSDLARDMTKIKVLCIIRSITFWKTRMSHVNQSYSNKKNKGKREMLHGIDSIQ